MAFGWRTRIGSGFVGAGAVLIVPGGAGADVGDIVAVRVGADGGQSFLIKGEELAEKLINIECKLT